VCPFCEAPYDSSAAETPPPASSEEPDWRREVAKRLEVYRSRRRGSLHDDSQSALPFAGTAGRHEAVATAVAPRTIARIRPPQHVEIQISQPQLDFSIVENFSLQSTPSGIPVAEMSSRRLAGFLDAAIVLGVFIGFLGLFRSMGGQLGFARMELVVYAVTFFLIFSLYFTLFTVFSGATPGMQVRGLSVVSQDGGFPETRQLLWRSFGYILSGGTFLLGFFWALWDEDGLTWQDRISHTYITVVPAEEDHATGETHGAIPHNSPLA
jgi:uncharacterized RDD family membrane protein YckC